MQHFRKVPQLTMRFEELLVDNFAGGGGASTGIEAAAGRPVDLAINHDPDAIAMHTVNHPDTKHYCEDVYHVDPKEATEGRPVGLAWFSPDCKHHSKARGGKPVEKKIRGLAWVAVRWAATVRPRIIVLENVEEFQDWGPLLDDKPDPEKLGQIYELFIARFNRLGYKVESKILRACDYGAPTIRKRFFLIARCDGMPIIWPTPTHGDPKAKGFKKSGLKPYRTAADIIDWSISCPSIFGRKKPLAENTLNRIAKGIGKYVFNNPQPFVVKCNHTASYYDHFRGQDINEPLRTVTQAHGFALVTPFLTEHANASSQRNMPANEPMRTLCAEVKGGHFALCAAYLAKHFGGNYQGAGADLEQPLPTVTTIDHNALCTAQLINLKGTARGARPADAPAPTITAGGMHVGEVRAFLIKYYGTNIGQPATQPLQTITTKHRFGIVTIHGVDYQIVDIGMRMLQPHELFAAQGFPKDYVINVDSKGNKAPKYKQVARCGNSVCPPLAAAIVKANYCEKEGSAAA